MASLHVRDVPEALLRELKVKAAREGVTMRSLVIDALELILNSKPIVYTETECPPES